MKSWSFGVALLGVALLAGQARASLVTINFDNLSGSPTGLDVVTNQYAGLGVTFSAGAGDVILVISQNVASIQNPVPYLGSPPNLICTGTAANVNTGAPAVIDCTHDVILTFSIPVSNFTFNAFGNRTAAPGQFAQADVFQNFSLISTPALTNLALNVSHTTFCAAPTVDCAADPQILPFQGITGITKVVIHNNTDTNGSAFDDFSFATADPVVPEPSTLLLTGLCGIIWAGRRFLTRKSM